MDRDLAVAQSPAELDDLGDAGGSGDARANEAMLAFFDTLGERDLLLARQPAQRHDLA